MTEDDQKLVERINEACNGHPHAKIAWPHYLLHDCRARIESLSTEVERLGKLLDYGTDTDAYRTLRKRAEASEARVRALEEALRPFAKAAEIKLCGEWRDDQRFAQTDVGFYLTFGHLRAVLAALEG